MNRYYMYSDGERCVENVESVEIRADGSHTLVTCDNFRHRMEPGWLSCGETPFSEPPTAPTATLTFVDVSHDETTLAETPADTTIPSEQG